MRKFNMALVVFSLLFVSSGNLFAQTGVSAATAQFLLIAPGARAGGLGEANVALANDAYATYWNPAGLAYITGKEFSGMHAQWLPQFNLGDMYYDYASYVQHFEGIGTLGFSATYINLGEQQRTDEVGNFLGTFSSFEYALGLSYGTKLAENFSVGSTVKFIYSRLSPFSAGEQLGEGVGSSVAVDLGLLWTPGFSEKATFGLNLQNLGPKITYVDAAQADPLPTNFKGGIAFKALNREHNKLTLTIDFNKQLVVKDTNPVLDEETGEPIYVNSQSGERVPSSDPDAIPLLEDTTDPFYKAIFTAWGDGDLIQSTKIGGGAEYWYSDIFSLRAGYYHDEIGKVDFATFGAGVRFSVYQFDFGYISGSETTPLSETMRFSLSFLFNE